DTAPTLVAMTTTQVPVVAWERRYMSVAECARLQSMHNLTHLPKGENAFRALGNAVNVELVERIAKRVLSGVPNELPSPSPHPRPRGSRFASTRTINIRPGVSVLGVLRHLNYQPWFALAEFVDNALQSFVDNRELLRKHDRSARSLRVDIT